MFLLAVNTNDKRVREWRIEIYIVMLIYGIGNNYNTLCKFGIIPKEDSVALFDKKKHGEFCDGHKIQMPEELKKYRDGRIVVLPSAPDEIVEYLVKTVGIEENRIIYGMSVNKDIVLENVNEYRYIMLSTDVDFLNFPYMTLLRRKDFTIRPILFQKGKIDFDLCSDSKDSSRIIFIVRDHCFLSLLNSGIIDYLKTKYTNSMWVAIMSDKCGGEHGRLSLFGSNYIDLLKECFQQVITYHKGDSHEYGLTFFEQRYPAPAFMDIRKPLYDVLFVGKAKNRIDTVHELYRRFKKCGVSFRFIVNEVDDDKIIYDDITYNRRMTYDEYLEEVQKCRCLVEACENGNVTSYRYAEAVVYNKKFITNDLSCRQKKYYNEEFMRCFENASDIDPCWIKKDTDVNYHYDNDFDPNSILEFIEDECSHCFQ